MQPKLTIQERLKDLRVERSLTLEQLSAETGISKSALGKYEADDFKDISPFSMVELAKFYGVSTDYLLGLTEQKNHPNTELDALHLGDDAIEVLRTGKFNHRLLSELICHKDFQRFMLDAEIYDVVPDKAVLVVDGRKLDEKAFTLNADEWAALPGTVLPYSGSIESAGITHDNGILKNAVSVDLKNVNFESSVQVKLYSGDTLLTTATLQGVTPGNYGFLTCCIATETADEYWSLTSWTPKDDVVPDKAVLVVDGRKLDEKAFTLNADEWAALPGTVLPYSGSIESAGITHDNGILKNAVSVDLKNVNFESSVQVKLYSGDTLLTTATLQGVTPGNYGFLTCCIATETADEYWSLTPWTPKDNIVPNKAVLFVDGHEQDTKTFTLDADEWAALPGTAFPYSGSIGGGYTYYTIKATAGVNGSISPTGNVSVREGRDQTFTITPDKGYVVANVKIDGRSIGAVKSYTFENVKRAHTIEVSFTRANEFIDVPAGSYYYDAVLWAVENGITKGTSETMFSPDATCSRAQIVTFLWRSQKSPAAGTANPFTDVKASAYYADAVLWAVKEDVTKGTTNTTFSPDANCTRAQIVTFIWRCKK